MIGAAIRRVAADGIASESFAAEAAPRAPRGRSSGAHAAKPGRRDRRARGRGRPRAGR
jgi:hypothetical protein